MKKIIPFVLLIVAAIFLNSYFHKANPAVHFLESLDEQQRKAAQYTFDDEERFRWHYLPAVSFERPGISLKDLDDSQKELVFQLLKANLSNAGYEKARKIMNLENVLAELENDSNRRDPEKYSLAIYGDPNSEHWAWSFQGHHVVFHFTVVGNDVSFVPLFLGANPAMIKQGNRKGERTLSEEEDLGFELINDLSDAQKAKAIIADHKFSDIYTTNLPVVEPLDNVGIQLQDMNESQRGIVQTMLKQFLSVMPDKLSAHRLNRLREENMDEVRFAYAGAFKLGASHYYRVQGKTFLLELDNSQNNANHIHVVWRDFDGDFGRDIIKAHYETSDHH